MNIPIPDSFRYAPFYQTKTVFVDMTVRSFPTILRHIPFYYELTGELSPWQQKHLSVPSLFDLWKDEEQKLAVHYRNRNPQAAKGLMIAMIAVYLNTLFWSHDRPVPSLNIATMLEELEFKPINCEERLFFLLAAPEKYPTYVQLKALFTEQEKIFAKMLILEQKRRQTND